MAKKVSKKAAVKKSSPRHVRKKKKITARKSKKINVTHKKVILHPQPLTRTKTERLMRTITVIKALSESMKNLDINHDEILPPMLVRFCIESVLARRGALLMVAANNEEAYYSDIFIYDKNNRIDTTFDTSCLNDLTIPIKNTLIGSCVVSSNPAIYNNVRHEPLYDDSVDTLCHTKTGKLMLIPLIVDNETLGIIEITRDKTDDDFTDADLESIIIISNFVSATMENAKLYKWAITDNLTKLYNRHHFFNTVIVQELTRSQRYGNEFSLLLLDVDNFKRINDTYGHTAGDKVLKQLTAILQRVTRAQLDVPARFGGDEFIILLPETGSAGALRLAERLIEATHDSPVESSKYKIQFSISAGAATFPKDAQAITELIHKADVALYAAKAAGRNCARTYHPDMKNGSGSDM